MLNRADLLRCLQKLGAVGLKQAAPLMGYYPEIPSSKQDLSQREPSIVSQPREERDTQQARPRHAIFYRLTKRESLTPIESSSQTKFPRWFRDTPDLDLESVTRQSYSPPTFIPLIPWAGLWVFLKNLLSDECLSVKPDIPKLVNRIAQGECSAKIPLLIRRAWSVTACILVDYNDRVLPFHQDFTYLVQQLKKIRGSSGLRVRLLCNKPGGPVRYYQHKQEITAPWQMPEPETPLIILSDLGLYDTTGIVSREWIVFSRQLRSAGCYPVALMPVPARYRNKEIEQMFNCVTWDRGSRLETDTAVPRPLFSVGMVLDEDAEAKHLNEDEGAKQLLELLALAIRVEPALLRAARYLPTVSRHDVGSEAAAWLHADVAQSPLGFYYRREVIERYQTAFSRCLLSLQKNVFELIRKYHANYFPTLRYEEIDNFKQLTDLELGELAEEASRHLRELSKVMIKQPGHAGLSHWGKSYLARQHTRTRKNNPAAAAIWAIVQDRTKSQEQVELPAGFNVKDVKPFMSDNPTPRSYLLNQKGLTLELVLETTIHNLNWGGISGSPLAALVLETRRVAWHQYKTDESHITRLIDLNDNRQEFIPLQSVKRLILETDREQLTIEQLQKPLWARAMGRDTKGLFADAGPVERVLRCYWHPPGLNTPGFWYSDLPNRLPEKPLWAESIACDQYGLYTEITYKAVIQRLRWISPGRFMMGSPADEVDREEDETLHEVILTRGFWLADTACTQALWQAVMGENPSGSNQGDHYPVERVSWDEVNVFIERINREIQDLALRLPTEAEWEYACRTGTQTPFSFGETITTDQVNYDGDYPYAGGNKGENRGKTVEVKALPVNNWGLYQMHGNVWEWCYDWYGNYPAKPVDDPRGAETGDSRVLRGGSWFNYARHARSAYRYLDDPSIHGFISGDIGFRLARGPEEQDKQGDSE
jgi:formylglycine-generating enzyme required for sulfatase activity